MTTALSGDGRFVVFASLAANLVPEDTNRVADVFVRDREAGTIERVSVGVGGAQADGASFGHVSISADGRLVAFRSFAANLVSGDTNGVADVFVRDREAGTITARPARHGDVVLARKDTPASYHLAVTVDDHLQGVTLVTRGTDLRAATDIHRLLQALLGLDVPSYHHHRLLAGADGRRLAKRDHAATLRALREDGHDPAAVIAMTGLDPDIGAFQDF